MNTLIQAEKIDPAKFSPQESSLAAALEEAALKCGAAMGITVEVEQVPLLESLGRVLQEDVYSRHPVPPFSRSLVDGYAVRLRDIQEAGNTKPLSLKLTGVIAAGSPADRALGPREAMRIMTGAPVPAGADAIIPQENAYARRNHVFITGSHCGNRFIQEAGEDVKAGQLVVPRGTVLNPLFIGMLAALNRPFVKVSRRLKVGIVSTGNELRAPGRNLEEAQIWDGNSSLLAGMVQRAGHDPICLGLAQDRSASLCRMIETARSADMIMISGGTADGDFDITRQALAKLGIQNRFPNGSMKWPARVFLGSYRGQVVFALPGRKAATLLYFLLCVLPVLDHLAGKRNPGARRQTARLWEGRIIAAKKNRFFFGTLEWRNGRAGVSLLPAQKFGLFHPVLESTLMVEVPPHATRLTAGDPVNVYFLP